MAKNLLEQAKAHVPVSQYKDFMQKLPAEDQQQIKALVDAYLAGELEGAWSVAQLYRRILVPNGYKFSEPTFRNWVSEYASKRKEASKPNQPSEERPATKRKTGTKR